MHVTVNIISVAGFFYFLLDQTKSFCLLWHLKSSEIFSSIRMALQRGKRKGNSLSSTSAPQPNLADDVSQQILDAIAKWESTGQDILREIFASRIDQLHSHPLASIPLSYAFVCTLESELEAQQLATLLSSLIEGFAEDDKEEKTELVGEALVDVVEVLDEEKEDFGDQDSGAMEVDEDGIKWKGREKGLEVIKLLLVSSRSRRSMAFADSKTL